MSNWTQVKAIFLDSLDLDKSQRTAYIARACSDHPELKSTLQQLLEADSAAPSGFLQYPPRVLTSPWLFRPEDLIVDRFRVRRAVARGATGEVYEAWDERLQARVALKALRPELLADSQTTERLRREVLVTRDIANDHLCKVLDLVHHVVRDDALLAQGTVVPCLTMQFLEGTTLEDELAQQRPLDFMNALQIIREIAEALDALHARGVVHRDLKPSNVMLVPAGKGTKHAVLTDFGLARSLDGSLFETEANAVGGAPYFMAPELLRLGRSTRASDIYALGLLLDEMVTPTRAFTATTIATLILQKLQERPIAPSTRNASIPKHWNDAILRCLEPEGSRRFPNSGELVAALENPPRTRWYRRPLPRVGARAHTYPVMCAIVVLLGMEGAPTVRGHLPRGTVDRFSTPLSPSSSNVHEAAFDAYMRARSLFEERTVPSALAAMEELGRALMIEPSFARAYALLADLQGVLMDFQYAPHDVLISKAAEYAERAVALEPESAEGLCSLAAVRQMQRRWHEAEDAYERALALHPGFARAHRWYGGLLLQAGRFQESFHRYEHALSLDPHDYPTRSAYALALFYGGHSHEAVAELERILHVKDLLNARAVLGQVYAQLAGAVTGTNRAEYRRLALEQADGIARHERRSSPPPGGVYKFSTLVRALAWAYTGEYAEAESFVQALEVGRHNGSISPATLARVYSVIGRPELAISRLEEAERLRDRELLLLKVSPFFVNLRSDPRFQALLERLAL